jgi:hypothetical protein
LSVIELDNVKVPPCLSFTVHGGPLARIAAPPTAASAREASAATHTAAVPRRRVCFGSRLGAVRMLILSPFFVNFS